MPRLFLSLASVLGLAFVLVAAVAASEAEPEEGAPVLLAREFLEPALLQGKHHRVHPVVDVDDFVFLFRVQSDFGSYTARGVDALRERVREIETIAQLREISQTEAFAAAISQRVKEPIMTTVGIARRPVSTVVGLPSGIARYLEGKFYQVRRVSTRAMAMVRNRKGGEDREPVEGEAEALPLTRRIGSSATSLGRKHLGYDDSKRAWAQRLGVDPYSDNTMLQEELGRIAWSSSVGDFAADFAIPSTEVVSYAGRAKEVVWTHSPLQLENAHRKALRRWGFSQERIEAFTVSPVYSLTEKAALIACLESLSRAEGIGEALDLALAAETEADALVMTRTMAILDLYSREVSPLSKVAVEHGMLAGYGANGYLVLPLAVDYLHWNRLIARALASDRFSGARREIWVSGEVSSIAEYRLRDGRWHVFERCFEQSPSLYSRDLSRAAKESVDGSRFGRIVDSL